MFETARRKIISGLVTLGAFIIWHVSGQSLFEGYLESQGSTLGPLETVGLGYGMVFISVSIVSWLLVRRTGG